MIIISGPPVNKAKVYFRERAANTNALTLHIPDTPEVSLSDEQPILHPSTEGYGTEDVFSEFPTPKEADREQAVLAAADNPHL